jgi:hypothetical protein
MTKKEPKVEPHWRARYCDGETTRPKAYRWEVEELGEEATRSVTGWVRMTPNVFSVVDEEHWDHAENGMTRRQAIAIASALNALDSLED